MAKYLRVAADASKDLNTLFNLLPESDKALGAVLIARVFNYGIRISPRGVQSTVRINAIREATKGLPIQCSLKEVQRGPYSFKALQVVPTIQHDPASLPSDVEEDDAVS